MHWVPRKRGSDRAQAADQFVLHRTVEPFTRWELHQVLSEHRWTSKRSVQADGGHPVPPTEQADDERGHAQLAAHVR